MAEPGQFRDKNTKSGQDHVTDVVTDVLPVAQKPLMGARVRQVAKLGPVLACSHHGCSCRANSEL